MIGKLILTHGGLARELLAAAQVISGRLPGIEALSLDWNDTFEEARAKVRAAVERRPQAEFGAAKQQVLVANVLTQAASRAPGQVRAE